MGFYLRFALFEKHAQGMFQTSIESCNTMLFFALPASWQLDRSGDSSVGPPPFMEILLDQT
jgi:hypothetical protein